MPAAQLSPAAGKFWKRSSFAAAAAQKI